MRMTLTRTFDLIGNNKNLDQHFATTDLISTSACNKALIKSLIRTWEWANLQVITYRDLWLCWTTQTLCNHRAGKCQLITEKSKAIITVRNQTWSWREKKQVPFSIDVYKIKKACRNKNCAEGKTFDWDSSGRPTMCYKTDSTSSDGKTNIQFVSCYRGLHGVIQLLKIAIADAFSCFYL